MHLLPILQEIRNNSDLPLRIGLGLLFLGHGYFKSQWGGQGIDQSIRNFTKNGIAFPKVSVYFSVYEQLIGGPLLILGFLTRFLAILFAVTMVVAAIKAKLPRGYVNEADLPFTALAGCLSLLIIGPGSASLDALLFHAVNPSWLRLLM